MPEIEFKYIYPYKGTTKKVEHIITPKPCKNILPEWYIQMNNYFKGYRYNNHGELEISKHKDTPTSTVKKCMPFSDYLTSGYVIPAWVEFFIDKDNDGLLKISSPNKDIEFNYNNSFHPSIQLSSFFRTNLVKEYWGDLNTNQSVIEKLALYKLLNPWVIKTPPGYSCLFFRPFYHDQKINIMPSIVDTDNFDYQAINFPFFVDMDFNTSVSIKLGDPLIYVFPFKREKWKSKIVFDESFYQKYNENFVETTAFAVKNFYKKFVRSLKDYS